MANGDDNCSSKANGKPNNGESISTTQSVPTKDTPEECMRASGSWLDQGGKCSIEYLPNVKCYSITLVAAEGDSLIIPQSKDGFYFTITPRVDSRNFQSILIDITFRSKVVSIGRYSFITICHGWGGGFGFTSFGMLSNNNPQNGYETQCKDVIEKSSTFFESEAESDL